MSDHNKLKKRFKRWIKFAGKRHATATMVSKGLSSTFASGYFYGFYDHPPRPETLKIMAEILKEQNFNG